MSTFKVGDRVRARHDHSFEGEVCYIFTNGDARVEAGDIFTNGDVRVEVGEYSPCMRASWLELVPDPPKYEVPVKLLASADFCRAWLNTPGTLTQALLAELAERGFIPEPDGEQQ